MVEKTILTLLGHDQTTTPDVKPDLDYSQTHRDQPYDHTAHPPYMVQSEANERRSGVEPSVCAGCGQPIHDRYYLEAVDKQWHGHCLKCIECQLSLDSQLTCFARDGNIYCKHDYYRRFAVKRCSRCGTSIQADELVMRARQLVYHLGCFACSTCDRPLATGDHFGMTDGGAVYCRVHYELVLQSDCAPALPQLLPPLTHPPPPSHPAPPYYHGVPTTQKGRPRKRKSPAPDMDLCEPHLGMGPNENELAMGAEVYHMQGSRQKRMRTSFKHHQIRTMKSYFSLNHNPDAKDLKQLAQKTGLNKRILQVWFQNARAKYRRNLMKHDPEGGQARAHSELISGEADDTYGSNGSKTTLTELSNAAHSPAMSDISSGTSILNLQGNTLEYDHNSSESSSLTELLV